MSEYRIKLKSSFGTGCVEIQKKEKFFCFYYYERFHSIFMNDGDANTAIRKAVKMVNELNDESIE